AKAAGFAGILRIFFSTFGTHRLDWQPIIWAVAVLSILTGSVLAVVQTDVKRMLAYSSISHAGYILVGLQAATDRGLAGALFYLRLIVAMYMAGDEAAAAADAGPIAIPVGAGLSLAVSVVATLVIGTVLAGPAFDFARHASVLRL